jgi:hypothetical protein
VFCLNTDKISLIIFVPQFAKYITNNGIIKNIIITYATGIILFLVEYSEKARANVTGNFFIGHQTTIPLILNNKWANATVTAAMFPVMSDASIAVIVVPIFDPNV